MRFYLFSILLFLLSSCAQSEKSEEFLQPAFQKYTEEQERIIEEYSKQCANRHFYTFEMNGYQECLDRGLEKDSTISYLWQQKAMPYFKARKYEVGMPFLDKAVKYNRRKYLAYRGFIKCIFSKRYVEAIEDFEAAIEMDGNSYEMDHTYKFYIALSYLQLNEFEKAEKLFAEDIRDQESKFEDGAHFLDLFYYGITKYELGKWEEAVEQFDKALETYPTFAEVLLYKGICLARLDREEEAEAAVRLAKEEGDKGNTFNEDNAIYEMYPYQFKWKKHNH
ncbi:tetratricopeptide repeat protein [Aequorivita sp. H23M31]|uniref:Tetratricopeptide repeat protein n=1 Tax=Aequorivita ciconiae TaxID=2494375 RepID=A0A410G2U7_9FLAO|nr:tetratricopeptide repeat protein [Aequorivita sp. H23M31]QAA81607.1 tetratricopeptide repeat protein [Aequorivita sp. H23M31]